ncbi:M1 family metallopeptidase [Flavobacterium paronense]|uniref:M1 family metallopeptidase n=1 Tax=Flavobacterium paronense TaxID=1392775 RepID=A0ABV5GGA1_9FLAO|nr:M1 family metallopeptidase [Flavobacterium paronense]MDN3675768.1 M1 family metallopeptidase [Flavobacterium paronense]MDN3675779.1 M1 family metallopeptidase [Flavobacterium paronense]MDN3676972.1 M1 family metallopeptidase [Flavobacterium paronense]
MKKILALSFIIISFQNIFSQETTTRKDSLQGGLRPERTCFDVLRYDLNIKVNPDEKSVVGYNDISFKVVDNTSKIQLDLFDNMQVDSIVFNSEKLNYKREFNAVFINFPTSLKIGTNEKIRFYYSGKPIIAKNAPWDGGFIFTKDGQGKPWVGVACQGTGASLWYPVKDSQSDEPDFGATIKVAVPNGLMEVSNGRLIGSEDLKNGYTRWDWEVKNPINTYSINVSVGDYVSIHENYKGLDLDYYVLRQNEVAAKIHFEEVKPMMDCFQSKFGPYPFASDSYKLVETPYLGMEHQSAVAYGNKYVNGYLGTDRSGTGIGLLFDYIIIHESGHEWFGNNITSKDSADMWIHEGFTCYTENVFVECQFGYEKGQQYVNGCKRNIDNVSPIIGPYGVNKEGSGDMYEKGALLLNTLRHVVNDDDKWWKLFLKYSETFHNKIIDTEAVISFFNTETGMNLTPIFNQYLRHASIPKLELRKSKGKLGLRWKTDEPKFNMPIDLKVNGKKYRFYPTTTWVTTKYKINKLEEVEVLTNDFYIDVN